MKKLFSIKYSDNGISFATLVMRVVFGGLMIPHGYSKLMHFSSMSTKMIDPFHIGQPTSLALSLFAEFFCAVFIIMGLFTRLACIPLIINMSVALFVAHHGDAFGVGDKAALFLGAFVTLLFTGPGKISLDRFIGK
ncbi:MAG TPA: DoxX family protein [Chitinophagaceae bacterium]|nr:DoxX family protein [Chitinophagaceae bacterium]